MAQSISQEALAATGLPGATAASRYAGATASGAPTTGTFAVGDYVVDQTGAIYICTVSGTPGTWVLTKASNITGTLAVGNGGLNATTTAVGSIPLGSSTTAYTPLAIGANNTVLRSNGTTAAWATDVISFSAGTTGLTPSSATTGAVTLAGTLAVANGGTGVTTSTGTGAVVLGTNPVLTGAYETVVTSATALSGTNTASLAASTASLYLYTANPTATFTVALTNVPTTTGQAVTFALGVVNGATAYLPKNITINGTQSGASSTVLPVQGATNNSITTYYQGATAWTAADVSTLDYYTITCICTGSSAWTMLLSQTKF